MRPAHREAKRDGVCIAGTPSVSILTYRASYTRLVSAVARRAHDRVTDILNATTLIHFASDVNRYLALE